jgi:hypothetical protein
VDEIAAAPHSAFKLLMIGNDSLRVLMEKVVSRPFSIC